MSLIWRTTTFWNFLLVGVLATWAFAGLCHAQQERSTANLTTEQTQRLDEAVELATQGELQRALAIYDALLQEVEMDLLYLNSGRILQRQKQCKKAQSAFEQVSQAPRVPNINASTIRNTLERYRKELERDCPGQVRITCAQPGMQILVPKHSDTVFSCTEKPITLPAGPWDIIATLHEQELVRRTTVRGTQVTEVNFAMNHAQFLAAGRVLLGSSHYLQAKQFLEEALKIKDDREVYLYIAEALLGQGSDQCQTAFVALNQVQQLPPSSTMSPIEVEQRLKGLREAFQTSCGEQVRIGCFPSDATIRIDNGAPVVCSAASIFLPAGSHTITATLAQTDEEASRTLTRQVQIQPGQVNRVKMMLIEEESLGLLGWSGLAGIGLGAMFLGSSILLDNTALTDAIDTLETNKTNGASLEELNALLSDVQTLQTTNQALLGTGLTLLVLGSGALLWDLISGTSPPRETPSNFSLQLTPDEARVQWQLTWD